MPVNHGEEVNRIILKVHISPFTSAFLEIGNGHLLPHIPPGFLEVPYLEKKVSLQAKLDLAIKDMR